MRRTTSTLAALVAATALVACTPHRAEVRQGNYITQEIIEQLEVGMSRDQVRYLLGRPIVQTPFRTDRWDYVYLRKHHPIAEDEYAYLVVWFEGDALARYEVRDAPSS